MDRPNAVIDFFECDVFVFECVRQKDSRVVEFEGTDLAHESNLKMWFVAGFREAFGHWSGCRAVARRRFIEAKSLVWTVVVKLVSEAIKAFLLRLKGGLGRSGGMRFERTVHAFVAPVLPGFSGLNALVGNAELDPPDAEAGQTKGAVCDERDSVVSTYCFWQSELCEGLREDLACVTGTGRAERITAYEEARVGVGDGERIAVARVAKTELSFVISSPDLVNPGGYQWHSRGMVRFTPASFGFGEPMTLQDQCGSALGRQAQLGMSFAQIGDQCRSTPVRMRHAGLDKQLDNLWCCSMWTSSRCPTSIGKPVEALRSESIKPLVTSPTADTEAGAQFAHRVDVLKTSKNKSGSFGHGIGSLPRHSSTELVNHYASEEKCYPCT